MNSENDVAGIDVNMGCPKDYSVKVINLQYWYNLFIIHFLWKNHLCNYFHRFANDDLIMRLKAKCYFLPKLVPRQGSPPLVSEEQEIDRG